VEEEISRDDSSAAKLRVERVSNIPSLAISDEATKIAELLLSEGVILEGSEEDALHIGIAAVQSVNYLLTWNFRQYQ